MNWKARAILLGLGTSLSLGLLTIATAAPIPDDEAGFTDFAATRIGTHLKETPVVVRGPLQLTVGALVVNLHRLYGFCQDQADSCEAELERFSEGLHESIAHGSPPVERAAVRMIVRTNAYLQHSRELLGPYAPALQVRPLVEGLVSIPVLDTPKLARPLNSRDLAELGMTADALFELARSNLETELGPVLNHYRPVAAGSIGSVEGYYEIGRLADPAAFKGLAQAQAGVLVVALPTTGKVLYTSEATPIAVDALRTLARELARRSPTPLTPIVLRWTEAGWVPVN